MCLILPVSNNLLKLRTPFNVSILGIKLTPSGSISHIKFTSAISSIFEVAKYLILLYFLVNAIASLRFDDGKGGYFFPLDNLRIYHKVHLQIPLIVLNL